VEGVKYHYAPLDEMMQRYNPAKLADGFNTVNGEEVFFVSNPALGLWSRRDRFGN
jgi:hypothetical protein